MTDTTPNTAMASAATPSRRQLPLAKSSDTKLALPVKLYLLSVIMPVGIYLGGLLMSPMRLLIIVMAIPIMIRFVTGRMGPRSYVDYGFLIYFCWTLISMAVVTPDRLVEVAGSRGIEMLGGYFLARAYIRTPEQFLILCKWLAVIAILLLPLAIIESVTRQVLVLETLRSLPGGLRVDQIVYNEERLGLRRAQVVFSHPIHFGLFCSICFITCLVALKGSVATISRIILAAAIATAGFLSLSSGAILAMGIQFTLVIWAFVFQRIKWRWYALVALAILAVWGVAIISGDPPIRVFMRYASFNAHNAFWRGIIFEYGMMNVMQHPIFGMAENASNWIRPDFMPSSSIDNFWLVIAVQHGIPGIVLLSTPYLWGIFWIAARKFSADPKLDALRYAWMFCFIGLTFTLSTVAIWKAIFSFVFFMYGAGIWMINYKLREDETSPDQQEETAPDWVESRYTRFPATSSRDETRASKSL